MVVAVFLGLCAWFLSAIPDIRHDDDVLAFLPAEDPDVVAFHAVAKRFGMLEVALVGLESATDTVLDPQQVARVRRVATRLGEAPGVRMVLSFADLPDPRVTPEGLEVAALVPESLDDAAEIRRRVLANEDAVGNLVAANGRAAALLVYLLPESGPGRSVARARTLDAMRQVVATEWNGRAYFAGAPIAEHQAAVASREDIERGSPIVIGVLALASAVMLRSITAALLNLVVVGLGVGLVMGAHGRFDEPLTVVSSTIPVLMVALGGAFGMHILAGYQRQLGDRAERVRATVAELWRPVVLSGLTTAAALFALLAMDQVPMQRFGVTAGLGVLLLLVLAVVVLPVIVSFVPQRWFPPRAQPSARRMFRPPLWVLAAVAAVGVALSTRLHADPDTNAMFDPDSDLRQASGFFDDNFGGSDFLQVAVEADLAEPTVLRAIRDVAAEVRTLPGIVDVRTLVEPIAVLTEALGGRRGIPETPDRARRVLTYLADHPAMAQLMTPDRTAALVHVKLAPMVGERQAEVTGQVREIVDRHLTGPAIAVANTSDPKVAAAQRVSVLGRVSSLLGRPVSDAELDRLEGPIQPDRDLLERIRTLRDRALDSEESPVEGVPRVEIDAIDPRTLVEPRGEALSVLLRGSLPTLQAQDPEGVGFVAEHLGPWIDQAIGQWRVAQRCRALDVPLETAGGGSGPSCAALAATLSELDDGEWAAPDEAEVRREIPLRAWVTGQPVLGQALARSVIDNLIDSTLVSLGALAIMLALSRQLVALAPALWTLAVTGGVLALMGHPVNIGTSMIACIALGAGVDFGIHLHVRAKALGGANAGERAVDEIGIVILMAGVQLAAAFSVLLVSQMPPLRQFGAGLVVGLLGAALGAIWLMPVLLRGRRAKT